MSSPLVDEPELRTSASRSTYKQLIIDHAIRSGGCFSSFSSKELAPLVEMAWLKTLQKGEHLYYQGSCSYGFYHVHTGAIRLYRVNTRGDEQVLHVARPGESFAEDSLFSDTGHALNASAVQNSTLVIFPKNEFLSLLRRSPEIGLSLLRELSTHLRQTIGLVDDLRLKSARTRLAQWLLEQCAAPLADQPQMISLSMPKSVLAAELGMASETFSRALAEFQSRDMLEVHGRVLTVLHPNRLETLASHSDVGSDLDDVSEREHQSFC